MKKTIFILIILLCFLLLTSITSAQFKFVPLDIISNFFNSILRSLGLITTATSQNTIPSSGTITYANPVFFGWGGLKRNSQDTCLQPIAYDTIIPMLDEIKSKGWNTYRYQSVPDWIQNIPGGGSVSIDHTLLRHLIDEAKNRDMYVILDLAMSSGHSNFQDGHENEWITEFNNSATPYKNDDNIILEPINEYDGSTANIVKYFKDIITALRKAGFKQPIMCNFWGFHNDQYNEGLWWKPFTNLAIELKNYDPLHKVIVGRHDYAQSHSSGGINFKDYNQPGNFTQVIQNSGIEDYWQNQFTNVIKPIVNAGIDYVATEMGSGWNPYTYNRGGVAFPMYYLNLSQEVGFKGHVSVIMHRWGTCDWEVDYDDYYQKAQDYFDQSFWSS